MMKKFSLFIVSAAVFFMVVFSSSSAKRIIFMPFTIPSHVIMHEGLARAMIDRGHEVWLVLPDTIAKRGVVNTTGISIIDVHDTHSLDDMTQEFFLKPMFAGKSLRMDKITEVFRVMADEILGSDSLYQKMKSIKADLFVIDDEVAVSKMFAVFPYRLGVPFAFLDHALQPFNRRLPFSPASVPAFMSTLDQHMTLMERLQNTWSFFLELVSPNPWMYEDAVARYAPEMDYIPLDTLVLRAEVWLIWSDPILNFPQPSMPNVKFIGGLSALPAKPLDTKFQTFMDSGKRGVIVVAFGSLVKSLPNEIVDMFMTAFLQLRPLKVVFATNVTSPDPDNILTSSWIPQNSLLAHPNCRVFVTHCGLNSQYQALYHGVPMLGLPLFYDQFYDANIMKLKGYGIVMDIRQVKAQELVEAIRRLIEEPVYTDTISKASRLFRELYGVPVTSAAYWLDHVMQYGGDYMRSSGQEMALYQWLMLDVLGIVSGCVTVSVLVICCCLRCLVTWFRKAKPKTD